MKSKKDQSLGGSVAEGSAIPERGGIQNPTRDATAEDRRTINELAAAVAFLEIMETQANADPDTQRGELNGTVANKGAAMLRWAAGEDNDFGTMVARFITDATYTSCNSDAPAAQSGINESPTVFEKYQILRASQNQSGINKKG